MEVRKVVLTEEQAAELLCIKVSTLKKWAAEGFAPTHYIEDGKRIYWMSDLLKFVNAHKVYPANNPPTCAPPPRGFIYLIKAGPRYKIGMTDDPSKRIKALQTGNPHRLTAMTVREVSNPAWVEAQLHRKYEARRVQGEWFRFNRIEAQEVKKHIEGLSYVQ